MKQEKRTQENQSQPIWSGCCGGTAEATTADGERLASMCGGGSIGDCAEMARKFFGDMETTKEDTK